VAEQILVIDDDPDLLRVAREFLIEAGYEVDTAEGGEAGLAAARAERPDLVVLDLIMPGMSGTEVFAALRTSEGMADVPIIFLTALEDETFNETAHALGADRYITKPCDYKEVLSAISETLSRLGS
jgi:DNA-binding response OmpR family regulator